jgi:hypothetical protein
MRVVKRPGWMVDTNFFDAVLAPCGLPKVCREEGPQGREGWGTRAFEVAQSIAAYLCGIRRDAQSSFTGLFELVCLETLSKLIFLRSVS